MSRIRSRNLIPCEAKGQRDLDCAVSCRVTSPHHSGSYCLCWVVLWELVIFGGIHVFSHCTLKKAVSYIHSQATTQDGYCFIFIYTGALAFLIAWFLFLWLWSIPIILIEKGVGRYTGKAPVEAFNKMLGPSYRWMGAFLTTKSLFIGCVYTYCMSMCAHV